MFCKAWSYEEMAEFWVPVPVFWRKQRTKTWEPLGEKRWQSWGVHRERMWGKGDSERLCPSEFPALRLLDFPESAHPEPGN